ncbi:MAG: hypothetical protein IPM42_13815 [Saprospiraceae bacterium]|nr:hypothetical protein [Saprospiraceae bacterium]
MDELKALTSILKQQANKNNADHVDWEYKIDKFEALIYNQEVNDDETAFTKLYGNVYVTNKYKTLKYRLKERLYNRIFQNASNQANLKTRAGSLHVISKNYTLGMILIEHFQRELGISLLEQTLKIALNNEHTPFIILISKQLLYHYSFIVPDTKKMLSLIEMRNKYKQIYDAEQYAENCNAEISHLYVTKKSGLDADQLERLKLMVDELTEMQSNYPTYVVNLVAFDLSAFYFLHVKDYDKVILYSKSAIEYFGSLEFEEKLGLLQSINNIALALLYQGKNKEADEYILKGFDIVTNGSRYWFRQMGIYFLSAAQQHDYDKMFIICQEAVAHKKLKSFVVDEEQWYIREAYVQFLNRIGKIDKSTIETKTTRSFVLTRFLNSVPFHSKDKQGQNISIIVIQILYLILDRKYNAVIDKVEGLMQYTYRHLKNDESFRSNCFIKMLLQMVKADFHPIRTRSYTEDLQK